MKTLTVKELLTNPKYKSKNKEQLSDVINNDLDFEEYLKIKGDLANDKAETILERFKKYNKKALE
jgi:hypothetical protein